MTENSEKDNYDTSLTHAECVELAVHAQLMVMLLKQQAIKAQENSQS